MVTTTATVCAHCGSPCPDQSVQAGEKVFCCDGCRTVYAILDEHQLCHYYDYNQTPGTSPRQAQFAVLDHPDIAAQLLTFSNGTIARVTFYVPTIHCSSCLYLLEHLYRIQPGITQTRVDFLKKQVHLTYQTDQLTLRQVAELLTSLGYEPLLSLNDVVQAGQKPSYRSLLYRLGVAGFCAGNIMLFSFPEYLGLDDSTFKQWFGRLNLLLALPVVFYSASGYFESVWRSLRKGVINIDVPILLGILVAFTRSTYEVLALNGAGYYDSVTGLIFFLLCGKWFQQRTYDFLSFERDYKAYFPLAVTVVGRGAWGEGRGTGGEGRGGVGEASAFPPASSAHNPAPPAPCPVPQAHYPTPPTRHDEIVPVTDLRKGDRIRIRHGELIPADGILYKGTGSIDYSFVTGESVPEHKEAGTLLYAGGKQVGEAIELEVVRGVSQSYLTQLWNNDVFRKGAPSRMQTFADAVGKYFTITVLILAALVGTFWYVVDPSKALNASTAVLIVACPCVLSLSYPFALGTGMRLLGKLRFYLKNVDVIEQMAACDTIVFDKTGTLTSTAGTEAIEDFVFDLDTFERSLLVSLAQQSAHPLSRRLVAYLGQTRHRAVRRFTETPGKGIEGYVCGIRIRLGSRSFVDPVGRLPQQAPVGAAVYVSIDGTPIGCFRFPNQYRPGIATLLNELKQTHDLYLLSGDSDTARVELADWFADDHLVFQCRPQEKLAFIQQLQAKGRRVVMIGDGLNDAGALKQADVGIAVSEDTIQFTPSSDAILDASSLTRLPGFLRYSRFAMRLIRFSFCVSLLYNGVGLWFALAGNLSPVVAAILMPLSSATMLLIATIGMRSWAGRLLAK
ncbi:ATPase, P-type (transporting), HAD superfamily, subfamily IC [Fibrisoma limi BUZ 3]|uniref:ATPase, P-type (Transporting), HAD superfamily, subfamily IC n=1 Tax=Fibrisoma limi BUZ 3 TaxID=1185876 RepID=I2GIU5_9BACT|nr:heavy metal translocating P-type ATPase metal-binding domain-containing protein [Fibrisoma limi]CCH53820.1 ATPase, P-type (transporting), HAD superfamily, subfamily IC [Fibrisoma limi BUZ 3]